MSNETIRKYLSDIDNLALQVETAKNIDYYVRKNVSEIADYTKKQILAAAKRKKTAIDGDTIEITGDDRTAEEIYNAIANDFRRILEKSREVYIFDTREYYYESPINIALQNKVTMYESVLNGTSNKIALLMVEKDMLERQISELKQQVGDKTIENQTLRNTLQNLLDETKRQLADFERLHDDEITKMTERLEELKKDLKSATDQYGRHLRFLDGANQQIFSKNKELSDEKADLQSRNQFLTNYNMTRTKENRELKQQNIKLDVDNKELKKQIDMLFENSDNLIKSTDDNKRTVNELKKQLEKCREELKTKSVNLQSVQDKIAEYKTLEKNCNEIQQQNIEMSKRINEQQEKITNQSNQITKYMRHNAADKAAKEAVNERMQQSNKINTENQQLRKDIILLQESTKRLMEQLLQAKNKNQPAKVSQPIEEKSQSQIPTNNDDDDTPLLVDFKSSIPIQNIEIVNLLDELINFLKDHNIAAASRQIDSLMTLIVNNKDVETKFKDNHKRLSELERAIEQKDQEIALVKSEHDKTKQMLNNALSETMDARLFMVAAKKGGGICDFKTFKENIDKNIYFHDALSCVRDIISNISSKPENKGDSKIQQMVNVISEFMEIKGPDSFGDPNNKRKFKQIFTELLGSMNTNGATKLQNHMGNLSSKIANNKAGMSLVPSDAIDEIKEENISSVRLACAIILVNSIIYTLGQHLPSVVDKTNEYLRTLFMNKNQSILIVDSTKSGGAPTTESPMALAPILSVIAAPMVSTTALIMTLAIAVIIFIFYVLYVIDTQSKIETPTRYIIEYRECQSQP